MIAVTYQLLFWTHKRQADRAQYVAGCETLKSEAHAVTQVDAVYLSVAEAQADPKIRATIWRHQPTVASSGWTYSHEPDGLSIGAHVYRCPFDPARESPKDILEHCRRAVLAPLAESVYSVNL